MFIRSYGVERAKEHTFLTIGLSKTSDAHAMAAVAPNIANEYVGGIRL